jgi:hypothetical protein
VSGFSTGRRRAKVLAFAATVLLDGIHFERRTG